MFKVLKKQPTVYQPKTTYNSKNMPTSPKKFGAVLPNNFGDLPVHQQRALQQQRREIHTIVVNLTGENYAEPLKNANKRSPFAIFAE